MFKPYESAGAGRVFEIPGPKGIVRATEAQMRRAIAGSTFDASSMMTFDQATMDAAGSFLISELERLDPEIHGPLVAYSWSRDIDVRTDVMLGDEQSSFTVSGFAASGGLTPGGKAWAGKASNEITGVALDIGKTPSPLTLWASELGYTVPELASAERLGRPIDAQKLEAINLKLQMDTDEQVYIGDSLLNFFGLVNSPQITPANVPNNAGATSTKWRQKTPDEILADINTALATTWQNSGWAQPPSKILLPPDQYGYIATAKISSAGNQSIMSYVLQNNISSKNGVNLEFYPCKWLIGRGVGGTPFTLGTVDRMVVYTQEKKYVRFPMTPLMRTNIEPRSLWLMTTYYCKLGCVEFVYPETIGYYDGI